MNRLKNYKRLENTKEDAELAKAELYGVLSRYDESLQEKITECIIQSYRNSLMEIERRKLAERAGLPPPRIDHFVHSILNYSFTKLHKGDRVKAYEIIEDIKDQLLDIRILS
jgi:hypothetical protein